MEGTYTLDLADYIQKSSKIHDLALTLQSCIPSQIDVTIEKLVEKELPVECVDIEGLPLKGASANPSFVTVYIKKDSDVESAKVVLSPQLIETAKKQPVEVTAYVELGVAGVRRKSKNPVLVSLQSEKRLRKYTFQPASFGFITSPKVAENFIVELIDETFTDSTSFMATNKAMEAYKKMQYHVLIEIRDEDASLSEILPRPVIYNFPPKDFKNGDIDIVEVPIAKTATFKLTPRNPTPN